MLLILILTVVHELGHLIAARACGVGVESFSVGFGPEFKLFTLGRIPFYLCLVPLGGGVALKSRTKPGCESRGEYIEDVSLWRKTIIFIAGALSNFFLAIIIQTAIYWFAPHEVKVEIFFIKFTFLPLHGAWYLAPFYAAKTVFLLFAALFKFLFLCPWFLILSIVKMAPAANGGVTGITGLGAAMQSGFWSFCGLIYFVSILEAAFQLLPCRPLDGGHIATALVKRVFNGGRISRVLSGAIRWVGVVLLVIIGIKIVIIGLSAVYRYLIR